MGTTRKAPTGAKHARCVHHEAYATAPAGWLCFSDETAPTDEAIIERMLWADDLEASRVAHRAAWLALSAQADGMVVQDGPVFAADGRPLIYERTTSTTGRYLEADRSPYLGDLNDVRHSTIRVAPTPIPAIWGRPATAQQLYHASEQVAA